MSHIVSAPLVITKKEDGSDLYLYEGAELPEHISSEETDRLVARGLVDKAADAASDDDTPARRRKPAAESN